MARVWNQDTNLSRETLFMRRSVRDAMKWTGTMLLCRQAYHQEDIELGRIDHCHNCWDEVLKQVTNTRCPKCFGTGYEGGYGPAFVVWGSLMENSPQNDKAENAGLTQSQDMTLKLPCDPIFRNGDVFAEVRRSIDGRPTELGRILKLDGPVRRQTLQGWVSNNTNDRDTVIEKMMIAQEGTVRLLLPTDVLYDLTNEFWKLDSQPYVGKNHSCKKRRNASEGIS